MNTRSLAGPLLAFASLAIMLAVIAVLVALILLDDGSSNPLQNATNPRPTIVSKPLASSYPFTAFFQLPDSSREVGVTTDTPANRWFGQFVLPEPTRDAIASLRRQANSSGLVTADVQTKGDGFIFRGPEIEGVLQLVRIDAENHIVFITLERYPAS